MTTGNCISSNSMVSCNGTIENCGYSETLCQLTNQYYIYKNTVNKNKDDMILKTFYENIVNIRNCFNHLLAFHNENNDIFHHIYLQFGGLCSWNKCASFRRYYCRKLNNRVPHISDESDYKLLFIQELFDQIHYNFRHQYDAGLRLTAREINIYEHEQEDNQTFIARMNIWRDKQRNVEKHLNYKISESNKFVSNLNVVEISSNHRTEAIDTIYSYSYPFNYWDHCQWLEEDAWNGLKYCDLYIGNKYKYRNLKEELLEHDKHFKRNPPKYWLELTQFVNATDAAKEMKANCDKYWSAISNYPDHPSKYGYHENESLRECNLSVIIIYCGEDTFQEEFSKTYRAITDHERLESIKHRHAKWYHFAKLLRETIDVYGIEYMNGNIQTMYHGIIGEMLLNGMQCQIFGILSTTSDVQVAERFSSNLGLILELVPDPHLKYFNCRPFSSYPHESELLFLGGMALMNVMNITNSINGLQFKPYVQALRIIDAMTNGVYYDIDPTNIHKMHNKITNKWTLNVAALGFTDISKETKSLTKQMMEFQLKYEPKSKATTNGTSSYVVKLLHQLCYNRKNIVIDWKSMNDDILPEVDTCGGYIGYQFLKSMICTETYDGIDIYKIHQLFPSIINIMIFNLPCIHQNYLDDILEFIQNTKHSNITWFELAALDCSNVEFLCANNVNKFKQSQFTIKTEKDEELETMKIVIRLKTCSHFQFLQSR